MDKLLGENTITMNRLDETRVWWWKCDYVAGNGLE